MRIYVGCHADVTAKHPDDNLPAKPANCAGCHKAQTESYAASVHGIALKAGRADSATCSDCHDGHTVLPPTSPESPLYFSRLAQTCGACHDEVARDVVESVHGKAVAAGHRDAPTCTDCHSEHGIEGLKATSPLRVSTEVCGKCHASERLNSRHQKLAISRHRHKPSGVFELMLILYLLSSACFLRRRNPVP